MTEDQAREFIESMTAWDSTPALTADQVTLLVRAARRRDTDGIDPTVHDEWAASTAYTAGSKVVPTVRNGHVYEVTEAGTTDTTEPSWPLTGTVEDGTVTFTEAGSQSWTGTYDLNAAAAEGWRWKAATVAGAYSFSTDGQSFNRSDLLKACQAMAQMYRNRVVGSIPLVLDEVDA